MKATLTEPKREHFDAGVRDKEYVGGYTAIDLTGREVVALRLYRARGGNGSYAAIWVHPVNGPHLIGTGRATGYGYHKQSAAAADAMSNAGVTLDQSIGGGGDRLVREAVEAIARAAVGGMKKILIVQTNP